MFKHIGKVNSKKKNLFVFVALLISTNIVLGLPQFAYAAIQTSIESIRTVGSTDEKSTVAITYSYDGEFLPSHLIVTAKSTTSEARISGWGGRSNEIKKGENRFLLIDVPRAGKTRIDTTYALEITIHSTQKPLIAHRIFSWSHPQLDKKFSLQSQLNDAIDMIDNVGANGNSLANAKNKIEKVILEDPKNAQAYLELARIAMKSDRDATERSNYQGLQEARRLIQVALEIDPNYANSYILYGYVLAVDHKTDEAIKAFKRAQKIGTNNLWLYYNWGLALQNANRINESIAKYREGIALTPIPQTYELRSNNRSVPMIFGRLIGLLEEKQDWSALDTLYQKQIAVLDCSCNYAYYAEFQLSKQGDYEGAIKNASIAYDSDYESIARPILAAAYLTKWALLNKNVPASDRNQWLNKGQALTDNSQMLIVGLAAAPNAIKVLTNLKQAGFQIDSVDAKGMTPLGYAAAKGDSKAVANLIALGANPNRSLSGGWTPLMIATALNQIQVVSTLLSKDANINHKSSDGQTARSIALGYGFKEITKLFDTKNRY